MTRPAAPASRRATATTTPSSRCGARSSTPSAPGSTKHWPTARSSPSSPPLAPGSAPTSRPTACAMGASRSWSTPTSTATTSRRCSTRSSGASCARWWRRAGSSSPARRCTCCATDGQSQYAYTDAERDRILKKWGSRAKVTQQRYKGLGEMNPAQLRETVFKLGDAEAMVQRAPGPRDRQRRARRQHALSRCGWAAAPRSGATRLMKYWDGEVIENGADD